jgi:hypothetical protein
MADKLQFTLNMGGLARPVPEQLKAQGLRLTLDPRATDLLLDDIHAVSRLYVRGVLTESETQKARKRIMKTVGNNLAPISEKP